MNRVHFLRPDEVSLTVPPRPAFLPVVMAFAEKSALSFGLAGEEALSLTLASEEIFSHLTGPGAAGEDVRLTCRGGIYYTEVEFSFRTRFFNMRAFNLTSSIPCDGEELPAEAGLLIAARMVDKIRARYGEKTAWRSHSGKTRYTRRPLRRNSPSRPLTAPALKTPDAETLKLFSTSCCAMHRKGYVPATS